MRNMKNLELSTIATFDDYENEKTYQEWFVIEAIPETAMATENKLLDFIKNQLISPIESLRKLSLCWDYKNEKTYNAQKRRFPVIQQVVNQNGKYFFNKGELDV